MEEKINMATQFKTGDAAAQAMQRKPFKLDRGLYPDVEETPYGFIYNVGGQSITDVGEHMRKTGMGGFLRENDNPGFTLFVDGDEAWYPSFDAAYKAAKGIK